MANRFSRLLRKFGLALGADAGELPPDNGGSWVSTDAEQRTDSVSRVYAQALLELAQADGAADAIAEEVAELQALIRREAGLDKLLSTRTLNSAQRTALVEQLFKGKVSDVLYRFIQVVNRKDRLGALSGILSAYRVRVAEARGEIDVDVYVAQALSDGDGRGVAESIGQAVGKRVHLHQHVDPELIGGLKVRVGDRLIDGSVATQLKTMKRKLVEAGREQARLGGQLES